MKKQGCKKEIKNNRETGNKTS